MASKRSTNPGPISMERWLKRQDRAVEATMRKMKAGRPPVAPVVINPPEEPTENERVLELRIEHSRLICNIHRLAMLIDAEARGQ
jgi:hypothetical protein